MMLQTLVRPVLALLVAWALALFFVVMPVAADEYDQYNWSQGCPDEPTGASDGSEGGSGGGSGYGGGNAEWFREATAPRGTSSR